MKLTIGHLYPDLLNLYGDRGNIQCMKKRCEWRGIEAEVREFQIDRCGRFYEAGSGAARRRLRPGADACL